MKALENKPRNTAGSQLQEAADSQRKAAGLPTYNELVSLVIRLKTWEVVMGGWDSPIWVEATRVVASLEKRPPPC